MDYTDTNALQDVVDANRILANEGVFDAFGHVSVRLPSRPDRFLLTRNLAPALATAEDVLEHDLDGVVAGSSERLYLERFIHAEIYRARPDVMAVVHSHSPNLLPFAVSTSATLRPVCHMCGFLGLGVPRFEIRDHAGAATDLLISDRRLGAAVATTLGSSAMVLMRGHGSTVVAPNLRLAVYRAIYAEVNARIQFGAERMGDVVYLTDEEAAASVTSTEGQVHRPWGLWKARADRGAAS